MTRVGAVAATPNEATAPIRKGAARDDGTTPFADALLDLLATMPQPAAKAVAVKTPPPAPSGDGTDAAPPAGTSPAALLQATLPDAAADAAAANATTPIVAARLVVTTAVVAGADAAAVDLVAANATATAATDQPADATAASAEPSAVPPDATTAAMQIAAAFALAVNGAGLPAPVITVAAAPALPLSAGTQAASTPSQSAVGSVDGAATPGSPSAAPLASSGSTAMISALPQAQFAAGFITLTAQWHPPIAAATSADALAGDAGDDAATPATDATTVTAAAPLPDGLAQLLAATVRQVSHASPDSEPALTASPPTHRAATTSDDANGSAPSGAAPGVAATAAAAAYPAVAAGAPVPLLNGGQVPSAPVDPGPRQMPEPKATPAPTAHATLELDADKTGASRIRIAVQGSQVRATITASDVGLASLDRQLPELRRSLEERGFSDIRLAVRAQDHVGTVAANASPTADDTPAFARNRSDQQAQGSTQQQDTGDRAGSQRRRRQKEDEPS